MVLVICEKFALNINLSELKAIIVLPVKHPVEYYETYTAVWCGFTV